MRRRAGLVLLLFLLFTAPSYADEVVVTFDNIVGSGGFVPSYTEAGFTFSDGVRLSRDSDGNAYIENMSHHAALPNTVRIDFGGAAFNFLGAETVYFAARTSIFRGSNGVEVSYYAMRGNFSTIFNSVTWIEWVVAGDYDEYGGHLHALDNFRFNTTPSAPVPEPATLILLATGFAGAVGVARKKRRSS